MGKSGINSTVAQQFPFAMAVEQTSSPKHIEILKGLENLTHKLEAGLMEIGLTQSEAKVYVLLAKGGAKKASEVAKLLNLPRTETYKLLNNLRKKGLASCTLHSPARFIAAAFENALNTLLGMEKQKLISFERQSEELLNIWSSIVKTEVICKQINEPKFQILEGKNSVYQRIKDIVSSAKEEVCIMIGEKQLMGLYHNEVTDHFQLLKEKGIRVKIITCFSQRSVEMPKDIISSELRILDKPINNMHYIIIDRSQLFFFIKDSSDIDVPSAIWTDCESLVSCISFLFDNLLGRS